MSDLRFYEQLGAELRQAAERPATTRRAGLWATLAASSAAAAGAVVAAVLLLSSGTPAAFASWSRVPHTPTTRALQAAVHECYRVGRGDAQLALPAPGGDMLPVLAEARGASAAAVYVANSQVYLCLTVNASTFRSVATFLMGPSLRAAPGPDQLGVPYGVSGGSGSSTPTHPHSPTVAHRKQAGGRVPARPAGSPFRSGNNFALGQAGRDVSAVTFAFADGQTVVASVEHGWYFAWWPWLGEPVSVVVRTENGASTRSPMGAAPHNGLGLRPYPACRPGSRGCVFAASRSAVRKTEPRPDAVTPLATVTRECDSFTLTYSVMLADAFARPPILTVVHGSFTALLNVPNGRADLCLIGGDEHDFNAFFEYDLYNLGPVHPAPAADKISPPDAIQTGAGGGRSAPSLHGEPAALRHSSARSPAIREILRGGGFGPFALGQTGSDVSAVSFTFANGKTTVATVHNGWYFAWWPWTSAPRSVTVTADSQTTTSPISGSGDTITAGCAPGSQGCVFGRS